MNQDKIFESLNYQFTEGLYECTTPAGIRNYKSSPFTKIKSQSSNHAIIEYDGKNPVYSFWYATFLSENNLSTERVQEIKLIGEPLPDTMDNLQIAYPNAKIVVIDKSVNELEYEDLYTQHTLVLHFFGDLFLGEKAYKATVNIEQKQYGKKIKVPYTTVPRRYKLEKLVQLIRNTRFIYNIFAYNCAGDDMEWQMEELLKIIKPDVSLKDSKNSVTSVCGHLYITSLKWDEDKDSKYDLEIAFEDRRFVPSNSLFYDRPLKETSYLDGLSKEKCGKIPSAEETRFMRALDSYEEFKRCSPYEIASEFRIYKLKELYESNDPMCDEILSRYMDAASDGLFGANNNIGVFYIQTEQNKKAKEYFLKGVEEGDEKAIVNMCVLAKIDGDEEEMSYWQNMMIQSKTQAGLWNKAIDLWNDEQFNQAVFFFEKLAKCDGEDKFQVLGKGICQMAIKNLIKIYSEGKHEAGIKKDYQKVQKLLEKVDYEDNKELVACCISNNFLTDGNGPFTQDDKKPYQIIKELYDWSIYVSYHTYNMACCYVSGLGCKPDLDKAIDICKKLLSEREENYKVRELLGYLYWKNGDEEKGNIEIDKIKKLNFKHKFNLALKYYNKDKLGEGKKRMMELEKVPGCEVCHECGNYNEILKICPRVLDCLGNIFIKEGNDEKGKAYLERAAGFGCPYSCISLGRIYKKEKNYTLSQKFYRQALYLGYESAFIQVENMTNNKLERLRLYLLLESYGGVDAIGYVQYKIYEILKSGLISRIKDDEYIWLLRSANNDYEYAIVDYAKYLLDEKNERYEALCYLRKYKGDDEEVKKLLAQLEDEFKANDDDDDDFDDDDGGGYYDDYDEPDYDRDSWDALTDGQYGDYPGPGWDPEMFGF